MVMNTVQTHCERLLVVKRRVLMPNIETRIHQQSADDIQNYFLHTEDHLHLRSALNSQQHHSVI